MRDIMCSKTRKIDGKQFHLQDETFLKSDANRTAKIYRRDGHKVRIVTTTGGHAVYVR